MAHSNKAPLTAWPHTPAQGADVDPGTISPKTGWLGNLQEIKEWLDWLHSALLAQGGHTHSGVDGDGPLLPVTAVENLQSVLDHIMDTNGIHDIKITNHLEAVNPHGLTASSIGAASASHNHDTAYAPKSHVSATGNVHGLTLADIGAASASHNHNNTYAPLSHTTNKSNPHGVSRSQLRIFVQSSAPSSKQYGDIWIDTSVNLG